METLQDQISNYEEQISLVQAQIAEGDSEELQQTLSDLNELVALLKDEISTETVTTRSSNSQNDEYNCQLDDLIGERVLVEHPMFSKFIRYHSAIVLDIERSRDNQDIARVLFSAPLEQSMKPCPYFLKGTCRFEGDCKFSHGEAVPLEQLQEYILPDFLQLKEGSLVLVPCDSGLYDVARVAVIDKDESAVKLLKSGKEISVLNSAMIPLNESANDDKKDEETYRQPNTSWCELKGPTMGDVSIGDLGQWNSSGFGFKMLQKMGYKLGQGLGKYNDGIVHSVQAKTYKKGKGFGSDQAIPASKLSRRQKKMVTPANFIGKQETEIFDFINKKLVYLPQEERPEMDSRKLKDSSESLLGTKSLAIELEIKKMRSNEKKLEEGIRRNKKDPDAAKKLEMRLKALQKDIQRLERQYSHVTSEQTERRQKKRDIF